MGWISNGGALWRLWREDLLLARAPTFSLWEWREAEKGRMATAGSGGAAPTETSLGADSFKTWKSLGVPALITAIQVSHCTDNSCADMQCVGSTGGWGMAGRLMVCRVVQATCRFLQIRGYPCIDISGSDPNTTHTIAGMRPVKAPLLSLRPGLSTHGIGRRRS